MDPVARLIAAIGAYVAAVAAVLGGAYAGYLIALPAIRDAAQIAQTQVPGSGHPASTPAAKSERSASRTQQSSEDTVALARPEQAAKPEQAGEIRLSPAAAKIKAELIRHEARKAERANRRANSALPSAHEARAESVTANRRRSSDRNRSRTVQPEQPPARIWRYDPGRLY